MNKPHQSFSVKECKIQAAILLKSLHSDDINNVKQAVKRLQRLPELADLSLESIAHTEVKHKHALAIIAREKGFKSWTELKCQLPFIRGGFLNQWFANYADAKAYLQLNGGFLFPFKNQFFICDANYITHLGFDVDDPDWKLIGNNWSNPNNIDAWRRLYKKWMQIQDDMEQ